MKAKRYVADHHLRKIILILLTFLVSKTIIQSFQYPEIRISLYHFKPPHKNWPEKCVQPRTSIAFAKTHKTGGSTLQNILLRYGLKNGLTFALPKTKSWVYGWKEHFNASMVTQYDWNPLKTFDLFLSHSIWNVTEVDKVIKQPSIKITILRDPIQTFESGYVYLNLQKYYNKTINEIAKDIENGLFDHGREVNPVFDQNESLWDLGMNKSKMADEQEVWNQIDNHAKSFDLVLIAERFDESLLLLKDLLCWNFEDILYIKQNQRLDEFRSKISEETTNILRKWLWADYQIYDTFNSHLTERINEYGQDRMTNDLTTFRQLNTKLKKDCQVQKVDNNQLLGTDLHMGNNMVQAYNVTQECKLYATSEPSFFNIIRTNQEQKNSRPLLFNKFFIFKWGK